MTKRSLSFLLPIFETGDVRFLTFRGTKPVQQKIEWLFKHCLKVSDTFVIVRELNKKSEGYHFHAILKIQKPPTKSWFIKGCHFHLQPIGKTGLIEGCVIPVNYDITQKELSDMPEAKAEDCGEEQIVDRLIKVVKKKTRLQTHVERVLHYMSKDFEFPIPFTDYIIVKSNNRSIVMQTL